jgi:hypothetical protein
MESALRLKDFVENQLGEPLLSSATLVLPDLTPDHTPCQPVNNASEASDFQWVLT